jgi:hypothetical protein
VRVYVLRASASHGARGFKLGRGSPLVVHRGQDAEVAVGDRDASVLEPALLRPPRGPARLALLNLGLVELLEVRQDVCLGLFVGHDFFFRKWTRLRRRRSASA